MRAPLLAVAGLIAGCEESPGLQLEVGVTDTSITTVELIVGAHCDGCPSEMAAPTVKLRETNIFSSPQPSAWFTSVDGAFVGFVLHADGDVDQRIPVLGIVGYNGQKQAVAYARMQEVLVPAGEEKYTRVDLKPIVPIDGTVPPDDRERIVVWRHPEQVEPSCMMIEHWSGGVVTTSAIVPPTDSDCDHVLQAECAPYIPNAVNVGSTFDNATCMVIAPFAAAPVCVFGGPSCTDGSPATTTACKRLDVDHCLPASLCECAPADLGCLFGKFLNGTADGTVTSFRCLAPITQTGELCPNASPAVIDMSQFASTGVRCKSIRFLDRFLSNMTLSDSVVIHSSVNVKLSNFSDACTVDLNWEGAVANPMGAHIAVTAIDLELDNGKHIDVPLRIDTVSSCLEQFKCVIDGPANESAYLCGQLMQ